MVKQGKHAAVSRTKQLRNLKKRFRQADSPRVIDEKTLTDFVLVRWHLVSGKQPSLVAETMQHFLQTWVETAKQQDDDQWSIYQVTKESLQQFNQQVPWQFYGILNQQWVRLQQFLLKEIPAVPLATPIQINEPLSATEWTNLLSVQLALNSMLMLFQNNPAKLQQVTREQIKDLSTSMQKQKVMDWQQVAKVFAPLKIFDLQSADHKTQQWLDALRQLSAQQLSGNQK